MSQDGEGKPQQHPQAAALRGQRFAHRLYSLFLSAPQPPEATAPGPLRLRAPAPPGPAAEPPRPLPGTPRGARSPRVRAGEKQPSSPLRFCFPFALTQSPRRGRPGTPATPAPPHSPGSLCCADRRRRRPYSGVRGGAGSRVELRCPPSSFFFSFQNKQNIYIYIYLFFHVELHQKSVWPHCAASTSK